MLYRFAVVFPQKNNKKIKSHKAATVTGHTCLTSHAALSGRLKTSFSATQIAHNCLLLLSFKMSRQSSSLNFEWELSKFEPLDDLQYIRVMQRAHAIQY